MSPRKKAAEPPFFPFYYERWLGSEDVRTMTPAARGIYIDLLCLQAQRGALPVDPRRIGALVGIRGAAWRTIWAALEPLFPVGGEGRQNESLARKLADYAAARASMSARSAQLGARSAAVRKSLYGTAQPERPVRGTSNGARTARSGNVERSAERDVERRPNIPTTSVRGSSVVDPARATPPAPPTRANPPAWPKGVKPLGLIVGEIAARVLAHHPPPPDAPDTTGEAGPGLEREGAA